MRPVFSPADVDLVADSSRIDLWCAYISDIGDAGFWSRYDGLLSAEERKKQSRFRFARDQRRYLLTRALVRTVLSRYVAVRPADWAFSPGPRGRPQISAPRLEPPLEFNIAHSADLVMLGVTSGRTLGVDAENIAMRDVDIEGLHRYFTAEESAALLSLPPAGQRRRFFELWTLKESYIKARGMGLAIGLDAFRFELTGDDGLTMHMRPELTDSPRHWRLWQLTPRPDYLAAVCAARGGDAPPRIDVREIVPLAWEKAVDVVPSRTTG
ncbi:MAG: 4'-phosphopantetheinyl transferase family protein [Steroidobacteraceae bacterium]